jgi:hypothetical protein
MSKGFAACVSCPSDAGFNQAVKDVFEAIEQVHQRAGLNLEQWNHHQGLFPALNAGISYGQGHTKPANLDNKGYMSVVQELLKNPAVICLAHYASGMSCSSRVIIVHPFLLLHPSVLQHVCTQHIPVLSQLLLFSS